MKLVSDICVNSKWIASFLAEENQECCECFGECKLMIISDRKHTYILTEKEIKQLYKHEKKEKAK